MMRRLIPGIAILLLIFTGPALGADATKGHAIAKVKCAGCHGDGGAGNGVMLQMLNVPTPPEPWTNKSAMAAFTDADLTTIITGGGAALGKPPQMPAFKGQLSDAQIADLIAYIRSLAQ